MSSRMDLLDSNSEADTLMTKKLPNLDPRSKWKKNIDKANRYKQHKPPKISECLHGDKVYKCKALEKSDIELFSTEFYSTTCKITQDKFILKYIECSEPDNAGQKNTSPRKSINIAYYIPINDEQRTHMQVCQKTFVGVLNISTKRIQRLARRHFQTGDMPLERRGGKRMPVNFIYKRDSVKRYIESLGCIETHYCEGESTAWQYLPRNVNISHLIRQYNKSVEAELRVKRFFFISIFRHDFNIGIGIPHTDKCGSCLALLNKLKSEKKKIMPA